MGFFSMSTLLMSHHDDKCVKFALQEKRLARFFKKLQKTQTHFAIFNPCFLLQSTVFVDMVKQEKKGERETHAF